MGKPKVEEKELSIALKLLDKSGLRGSSFGVIKMLTKFTIFAFKLTQPHIHE